MTILYASLLSLISALALVQLLTSPRLQRLALDHPNERSLHTKPVPRTGGLAIVIAASTGIFLRARSDSALLWTIALGLAAVSFLDDRRGLSIQVRLAAQLAAAVLATIILWDQPDSLWWLAFATLATVWLTNLYNFMDGADGLAGGMAVLGFGAYAVAANLQGQLDLAAACACIAAASISFLTKNLPPATLFMGDVGSTTLGFAAATLGFYGVSHRLWPLWFPAMVFLPFVADATITLCRRAAGREPFWRAHRQHNYQRLIRSGWSHARMATVAYALMLGTSSSAIVVLHFSPSLGWAILSAWLCVIAFLMRLVDVRWSRHVEGLPTS